MSEGPTAEEVAKAQEEQKAKSVAVGCLVVMALCVGMATCLGLVTDGDGPGSASEQQASGPDRARGDAEDLGWGKAETPQEVADRMEKFIRAECESFRPRNPDLVVEECVAAEKAALLELEEMVAADERTWDVRNQCRDLHPFRFRATLGCVKAAR